MKKSKILINSFIATVVIIFLSEWIQSLEILTFPPGFRHVAMFVLFFMNWLLLGKGLNLDLKYKKYIFGLSIFLVISLLYAVSGFFNFFLGLVFTFVFVILFILGSNIKTSRNTLLSLLKALLTFITLTSVYSIFEGLIKGISLREGVTLFREVGALGTMMNIGVIIALSLYVVTKNQKKFFYYALFLSLGVLLTILKKTIISNLIVWTFYFIYESNVKSRFKIIFFSIFVVFAGFLVIGEKFEEDIDKNLSYLNDVGSEDHVRLGMYYASYNVARDYFPFGSGLGSFASLSSITGGYSKLHYDYNVAYIGYNGPEHVSSGRHTLLDTFWPHIIAELGVLGSILYLFLWFFPVKKPFKLIRKTKDNFLKGISFLIILINFTMFWEGFTLYTPEIPGFVLIHSGLVGLCYFHLKQKYII
ncbi:hypothetical protein [Tenacibaculum agarivorans]|uniref:hypothetical protein n=1 Tax=Tenacibaculum agarivorans TaxID=1908389 RepID=UPI00094BAF89|nr:hypothetical protein [Tenacibaculum agarivorans]